MINRLLRWTLLLFFAAAAYTAFLVGEELALRSAALAMEASPIRDILTSWSSVRIGLLDLALPVLMFILLIWANEALQRLSLKAFPRWTPRPGPMIVYSRRQKWSLTFWLAFAVVVSMLSGGTNHAAQEHDGSPVLTMVGIGVVLASFAAFATVLWSARPRMVDWLAGKVEESAAG